MSKPPLTAEPGQHGALHLLLDRPERRNALDEATVQGLLAELDKAPETTLLLGSTTAMSFCAGADRSVPDEERARCSDLLYQCYERMIHRPGAVIAVVEGAAVGGGAQLSTAADLRVAGPGAWWRWAGPGHGLAVGAWALPSLLGRGMALELTLSGRWVDADEACRIGLVQGVHEDPWETAAALAGTIASLDADAVARVKTIATRGELPARLAEERASNYAAWTGAMN